MTDFAGDMALKIAAHDLPPVVALRGHHVDELHSDSAFAAMAYYGAHLQFSGVLLFLDAEMNFHFRPARKLFFAQDAHACRAHIREKADGQFIRRAE
jgi:hypothetical protein